MYHSILLPFTYQTVILLLQGSYKPYSRSSSLRKFLLVSMSVYDLRKGIDGSIPGSANILFENWWYM